MPFWLKIFSKSPFKPMIEHGKVVKETVETLELAVVEWYKQNYDEMERLCGKVDQLEKEADKLKESIRDSLSHRVMMPVSRNDVLLYLYYQDKIADRAQDVAKWLPLRKNKNLLPEELRKIILEMAKESIDAVRGVYEAITQLDIVLESGFNEEEIKKEYEIIKEVETVESKIDKYVSYILNYVFQHDDEMKYSEALYILNLSRLLSSISDKAKDSVERIRQMLARS